MERKYKPMQAAKRILVALDMDSAEEAARLADLLRGQVGGFKVGMQLFYRAGPPVVRRLAQGPGLVFLDLKLHDIPQTVGRAMRALVGLGADLVNVHASGGAAMMRAAAAAAREEAARSGARPPRLLAVTVLTSLDEKALGREIGVRGGAEVVVLRWATLARDAGMDGVVCSPREISRLRETLGPEFLIVTPGIRPAGAVGDDQKRIATPAEAVRMGADYLVIGRPVTGAPDPLRAVQEITASLSSGDGS